MKSSQELALRRCVERCPPSHPFNWVVLVVVEADLVRDAPSVNVPLPVAAGGEMAVDQSHNQLSTNRSKFTS